jgi:putative membrane protein
MWYMHGAGAGWWIVMSFGMVAFWGFVIWAVWRIATRGADGGSPSREQPGEILKRRLASGEISQAEYAELRRALDDGGSRASPATS